MSPELLGADGIFSAADAATHGLDGHALDRWVRSGACVRLTRGWYAVTTEGSLTPERRHALTALALARAYAGRAVVSHHSALVLRGLPTYAVDLATVHLTSLPRPEGAATVPNVSARRTGLLIHRPLAALPVAACAVNGTHGGAPTSNLATIRGNTLSVPLACAIAQTGLVHGPEAALVSADAALRASLVTADQLRRAVAALVGHPGIGPTRAALVHADGRHESPGESRTAFVLRALGFELDPQVELEAEGRRFRADFRIRGTRVLVEFDGAVKYADGRALFHEKQREDALRRAGWVVVRVVWADLAHPARLLRRVREAIALAAA